MTWEYFVNWKKVYKSLSDLDLDLNILNYAAGHPDAESRLRYVIKNHPSVSKVLPVLVALRSQNKSVLVTDIDSAGCEQQLAYKFDSNLSVDEAIYFSRKTGIIDLLINIKNVPDYVLGVEVGLDSNGRKNRAGTSMEELVKAKLHQIACKGDIHFLSGATYSAIWEKFCIKVEPDRANRRFDFAVKSMGKLILVETNYYSGGGSKLKAVAGELKVLHDHLANQQVGFVWITDGEGWKSSQKPLREAFDQLPYILNLHFCEDGLLEDILIKCEWY